jgi:murein endopeptidase
LDLREHSPKVRQGHVVVSGSVVRGMFLNDCASHQAQIDLKVWIRRSANLTLQSLLSGFARVGAVHEDAVMAQEVRDPTHRVFTLVVGADPDARVTEVEMHGLDQR